MSEVIGLGYLGLSAPDLAEWRAYATEVLGLQVVTSSSQQLLLRMDERGWRFAIQHAESGGLAYTGWEVANRQSLEKLGNDLADAGVSVKDDPALAAVRWVESLLRCADPDGHNLEFFYGSQIPKDPFVSPRGVRFVTGDLGLGHIFHFVTDIEAAKRFYLDLLGFRLSDTIVFNGRQVHFAHVRLRMTRSWISVVRYHKSGLSKMAT
jgi:3,4-dihydroxy-9,10-secoandrosta-1,3,5(10)-triene-9,17-dione 4,5-dioxygenase